MLHSGKNEIEFRLINKSQGYTYAFEIDKNNQLIFKDSCGNFNVSGCNGNDQALGIVYDKIVPIIVSNTGHASIMSAPSTTHAADAESNAQSDPSAQTQSAQGSAASVHIEAAAATQNDASGQSAAVASTPQAPTPDSEYYRRTNSECAHGFFGKSCRHNIRQQVCANVQPNSPDASVCKE